MILALILMLSSAVSLADQCTRQELYLEPLLTRRAPSANCAHCSVMSGHPLPGVNRMASNAVRAAHGTNPWARQALLPEACFASSMKERPKTGYVKCEIKSRPPAQKIQVPPPCMTPTLVHSVRETFAATMNCLGVDQREVFPVISVESHFQPNVEGSSGHGIGQITSILIEDVEQNRRLIEDLSKPECQRFEAIISESLESPTRRFSACSWVAVPENPARNLLYAGVMYRAGKRVSQELATKIAKTPQDVALITVDLARAMYNAGIPTIRNAFESFAKRNRSARLTHAEFWKQFSAFLRTRRKTRQVAGYVEKIRAEPDCAN